MPTESSMLPRAPLVFVLGQVRFSPVLKMEHYIPDIQERLRLCGFPGYQQQAIQSITFGFGSESKVDFNRRWIFTNDKQTQQVMLSSDAIVYQTTDYKTFEAFLAEAIDAFRPIADIAKITRVEQVGLRYVDLLVDIDGITANDLVKSEFRGISATDIGAQHTAFTFVFQAVTPCGVLTIRSAQSLTPSSSPLPPDIAQTAMTFSDRVRESENKPRRVLDFDHITVSAFNFSLEAIESVFLQLHEYTSNAFRTAVTPEALNAWRCP